MPVQRISGIALGSFVDNTLRTVVPQAVKDVQFVTTLTTPVTIATADQLLAVLIKGDETGGGAQPGTEVPPDQRDAGYSASQKFFTALKPTVYINSPAFGNRVYAPFGKAGPKDYIKGRRNFAIGLGLIAAGLIGVGFALGYKTALR